MVYQIKQSMLVVLAVCAIVIIIAFLLIDMQPMMFFSQCSLPIVGHNQVESQLILEEGVLLAVGIVTVALCILFIQEIFLTVWEVKITDTGMILKTITQTYDFNWSEIVNFKKAKNDYMLIAQHGKRLRIAAALDPKQTLFETIKSHITEIAVK